MNGWDQRYRTEIAKKDLKIESLEQKLEKFKDEYEQEEEGGRRAILKISSAKPGQSPGDDRTKEPYDKDWPPPAPLAPKLAGLRINPNTIMLPKEPAPAESDDDYGEGDVTGHPDWKLAHGEYFDEYGRIIQDPGFGIDRGGNPIRLPHMEQTPEEAEQNKQLHIQKYHQAMAGPDYIGDKLRYGQLDRILNPFNDFRKPTLDQLRIHSKAYPKA